MSQPASEPVFDYRGQVAVITGAGRNLGAEIARRYGRAGAAVMLNYHTSQAEAQAVVAEIVEMGAKAAAIQGDISRREDVERLFAKTIEAFGRVDILINNSGIFYPSASVLEMSDETWDGVINTNLRGVFLCSQAAARQMVAQGQGGAIVNIASIQAFNPGPYLSHYCASKAGVVMYTRVAAYELGEYNIRVNAVSPGLLWNEQIEEAWPEGVESWKESAPLGRLGRHLDVAEACLFLTSPSAAWITGSNLVVDGGVTTKRHF